MADRGKIQQPRSADLPVSERAYDSQVEENRQDAAQRARKNKQDALKRRRRTQQENFDRITRQVNENLRKGNKRLGDGPPLQESLRGDKIQTGILYQNQTIKKRPE